MKLNVIHEDNHIIVVEKPSGTLSQAGSLELSDMLTEIKTFLKEKYEKPGNVFLGLVHRLDTNVGGVMVFAKTSKAASRLSDEIRKHNFEKKYLAVVQGELEVGRQYDLVDYLIKDEDKKQAYVTDDIEGKKSILMFTVISTKNIKGESYSLLNIELETGRFHQIRVQLANLGYPIYNDGKYGKSVDGFDLGLFSYEICFTHPTLKYRVKYHIMPKNGIYKNFSEEIEAMEESL